MTPKGFKFAAVEAAVKKPGRLDLGLVWSECDASVAAMFTRNTVVAAPVVVSRKRAALGTARGVLVNSGNANACTGEKGVADALYLTAEAASLMGVSDETMLVCSTGVIGTPMPVDRVAAAIPGLKPVLAEDPAPFARCIMTTDTVPKVAERTVHHKGVPVRLLGIAKGAGMIRPDMATMLAFIVTDAKVQPATLRAFLKVAVNETFNTVTIDGDTSTNDTIIALANGQSGAEAVEADPLLAREFSEALFEVCAELARLIVKDGEGVTKVVDIYVKGAKDDAAARKIAFTIAESPLVKTAFHGEDPNWGRIAGAMGRSGAFEGGLFNISIGLTLLVKDSVWQGQGAEAEAHAVMKTSEYPITVEIHEGTGSAKVTTCDFSADYVRINADYRS